MSAPTAVLPLPGRSESLPVPHARPLPFFRVGGFVAAMVLASAAVVSVRPDLAHLVGVALYEVVCQMVSTPVEPYLLYCATRFSPALVAGLVMAGCLAGGVLNYWIYGPLLHHPAIRRRYAEAALYRRMQALFRRAPFLALVVVAYSPIPFAPFMILAIADDYPLGRYELAMLVGRVPRYGLLAWLGYALQPPVWLLVLILALLVALPFVRRRGSPAGAARADVAAESGT